MSIIVKVETFLYLLLGGRNGRVSKLWQANEISYNSDRNICLVAGLTILIYVNVLLCDIAQCEPQRRIPFPLGGTEYGGLLRVKQANFKLPTDTANTGQWGAERGYNRSDGGLIFLRNDTANLGEGGGESYSFI